MPLPMDLCSECHKLFHDTLPWSETKHLLNRLCPTCTPPFELTEREMKIARWLEAKIEAKLEALFEKRLEQELERLRDDP